MYTRKQYLNKECTHREFYAQFVTDGVRQTVAQFIGVDRIRESTDPHFNDIPLREWDAIFHAWPPEMAKKIRETGDYPTLGNAVCIAKEAARQIKDS